MDLTVDVIAVEQSNVKKYYNCRRNTEKNIYIYFDYA
jgi:hypothetical protein